MSTYLLRIGQNEIPFIDFFPVYGPLFLYVLFFSYKLLGGLLAGYICLYGLIMPFLGVLAFAIFSWFFFKQKRFACYFMLLVLILNSFGLDADGSNGYILRIFPVFLGLLILRRGFEGYKNWQALFGVFVGVTSMYDYPAAITLVVMTLFYYFMAFWSLGFKKAALEVLKVSVCFTIPVALWVLFFTLSGTFPLTGVFITHLLDKVPAYFLDTPANFNNIAVFFKQQFFYLVLLTAYAVAFFYLIISILVKKRPDMRFQISLLLLLIGAVLLRRIFIEYWRSQGIVIVPLILFILFNLEQSVDSFKKKTIAKVIESVTVGCLCIFSIVTSFNVNFLKGRFFTATTGTTPVADLEYFNKAGMVFRKDEVTPCREVLEYIDKNIPEYEAFYTYPWGLYNYFSHRRVPVRINSDYLGLADPLFFERMVIEDLKKRSVNYIVVNRQNSLGVISLGPRGNVADFYCWGDPDDVSFVKSDIAKFILENYQTEAILPAGVVLKKRAKALVYPSFKLLKEISSKELYEQGGLDGAKNVALMRNTLNISAIKKTVTLSFDLRKPLTEPSSLLRLKVKFQFSKLDKLWNQKFFDCTLRFVDENGNERSSTIRHNALEVREGALELPFIYAPVKIVSGSIVLDFRPSVFSGPPSCIKLGGVEFLQHQDKGY